MDAKSESPAELEQPKRAKVKEMPAYGEFKEIVHRKLRLIALCLGLDVLHSQFRPNFMTGVTVIGVMLPVPLFISTSIFSVGEMALSANACVRLGIKVSCTVPSISVSHYNHSSFHSLLFVAFFCCSHAINLSNQSNSLRTYTSETKATSRHGHFSTHSFAL